MDGVTVEQYESDIGNNLYRLWNRLSSGSYFPQPVKRVEIPKADGSLRPLGIPTVEDRIAQMVVKQALEPELEQCFHIDSYGYRPGRSAIEAIHRAERRCQEKIWAVDVDIKGFFDNLDHSLLLKALDKHNATPWVRLYVTRWLTAPVRHADGRQETRKRGTPQGGVISPLLANLFLHYALDVWVAREYPKIPFERYADDVVYHCRHSEEAERFLVSLKRRLKACGLEAHPEKTCIVLCKNSNRKWDYPNISFDFLGYRFQPRKGRNGRGQIYTPFLPSMSPKAFKRIKDRLRQLKITSWVNRTPEEIAKVLNPLIKGWLNYYGHFGRAEGVYRLRRYLDELLFRWARKRYKRLRGSKKKSWRFIRSLKEQEPTLFAHWNMKMS